MSETSCRRCILPAVILGSRVLCAMHYRFDGMRQSAKRDGKYVPTESELLELLNSCKLSCPVCKRAMNWRMIDGTETVITLQHNRDGTLAFLCMSCNSRHQAYPADDFFKVGPDRKRCSGPCKRVRPLSDFATDNGRRWANKKTICKECAFKSHKNWIIKNRERYNSYMRAYNAKRKATPQSE